MDQKPIPDAEFSFLSGAWFGAASLIPVIFFAGIWYQSDFSKDASRLVLFVGLPIVSAAFCGFSFGAGILDPNHTTTARQAAVQGIKVALWSYAFYVLLFSLALATYYSIYDRGPEESIVVAFIGVLFTGVLVALFGFILVGWLLILVNAIAGWLLFRNRLFFRSTDGARRR